VVRVRNCSSQRLETPCVNVSFQARLSTMPDLCISYQGHARRDFLPAEVRRRPLRVLGQPLQRAPKFTPSKPACLHAREMGGANV
jgi:hypothetical protein